MNGVQVFVLIVLIVACFVGLVSGQILGFAIVPDAISIAVNVFMAFCMIALARELGVKEI